MGPNGLVLDQHGMMKIALDFYKNLFGKEDRNTFGLVETF